MSRENVEIVKRIWPGDIDMVDFVGAGAPFGADASDLLAADAEIVFLSGAPGVPDLAFRGLDGFEEGWRDWLSPFASYVLDVQEVVGVGGDEVLVLTHVRARTHRDGVLVEHDPAAAVTVSDGKVVRVRFFLERSEALEALGLPK
jgi:ketosteroid isomerase-like protein